MVTGDADQALKRSMKLTAPLGCARARSVVTQRFVTWRKILRVDAEAAEQSNKPQQGSVAIPPDVCGFSFHIYLLDKKSAA